MLLKDLPMLINILRSNMIIFIKIIFIIQDTYAYLDDII